MATPKVTVRETSLRGKRVYVVWRRENGKPKRNYFDKKRDADLKAQSLRGEIEKAGAAWFQMTPDERHRLMMAYREAQKRGLDLYSLVMNAGHGSQVGDGPMLADVIDELLQIKERAGRSEDYLDGLGCILKQFAKDLEGWRIGEITLPQIEAFIDSKNIESRATLRARLSTLFRFAVRREYRLDNPCSRLEPVQVNRRPPEIFTIAQVKSLLAFFRTPQKPNKYSPLVSYAYGFPWFVLSTFCGLRPEEAEQTRREDIHLAEGWIRVEAQTSKVRERRFVYPRSEALEILRESLDGGRLPITWESRRWLIRRMAKHLGWQKWKKDVTRHTAASFWLPVSNPVDVSKSLGNSVPVLLRDYQALVTVEKAKEFWDLLNPTDPTR